MRTVVPGGVLALSTAYKTGAQIFATTGVARRGFVMTLDFSQIGAPNATDCQIQYDVSRISAPSTSATAYVPGAPADPADALPSATMGVGSSASTEPTVTANTSLFNRGINQRNSFRWDANDRLSALVFPAVANAGFAFRGQNTVAASFAGTGLMTPHFEE